MKYFLITVTILDGSHEHTAHCLLRARSEKNASRWAKKQCNGYDGYFSYGDGLTRTELNFVKEIKREEAKLVESLGLAYFT
jgi:hypothetical protein